MFAQYAGEGSRFVNHVDNTAGYGRILTIAIYLNLGCWTNDMGGALRITQPQLETIEQYKADKISDHDVGKEGERGDGEGEGGVQR